MSLVAVAFVAAMFTVGLLLGFLIGPIPPIQLRSRRRYLRELEQVADERAAELKERYGDEFQLPERCEHEDAFDYLMLLHAAVEDHRRRQNMRWRERHPAL